MISVSIYCFLIKFQAKQKHLLPFRDTNNELKKFYVDNILLKKWIKRSKTEKWIKSKNKLKEIDIKSHTCYSFDDIIKIQDFGINNILID